MWPSKVKRVVYLTSTAIPATVAVVFGVVFVVVAFFRLKYPFELEWIEGAYLDQARWLAHGGALYGPPSIRFIPTNKTPLFFWISSLVIRVLGEGFLAPRLVSFFSTVGILALLGKLVYEETGKVSAALVSGGLYVAAFRFAGAWMDIGKTDSLFIFLLLLGYYWQYRYENTRYWFLAPVAFVLSYYTKQMALPVLLVVASLSLVTTRLASLREWGLTFLLGGVVFLWLDWKSNGWFSFYTFDTTIRHTVVNDKIYVFWDKALPVLWPSLLTAIGFAVSTFFLWWRRRETSLWTSLSPFAFALGLLLASWSVFLKVWTYDNDLLPLVLGCALLSGLAYGKVLAVFTVSSPSIDFAIFALPLVTLLLSAQFFLFRYDAIAQIPSRDDVDLGRQFVTWVTRQEGDVWVFNHGFYTALAGKPTFLHSAPLGDVLGVSDPQALSPDIAQRRMQVVQVVQDARKFQRFSWIVVDKSPEDWLPYYLPAKQFFVDVDGFYPVTGAPARPKYGLIRNPVVYGGIYPIHSSLFAAFAGKGWHMENMGAMMYLSEATLDLALEPGESYAVSLTLLPYCSQGIPVSRHLEVLWNDTLLGESIITSCKTTTRRFPLASTLVSGGLDTLTMRVSNLTQPEVDIPWLLGLTNLEIW